MSDLSAKQINPGLAYSASGVHNAPAETDAKVKSGFTIIEVSLFLAITGLMLIGILGGMYASIATQRYNDSLRGFAEFLRQTYSTVISPESIGNDNDDNHVLGNSNDYAIYGKLLVFGLEDNPVSNEDKVYTATIVGNPDIPVSSSGGFISELAAAGAGLFCGVPDAGTGLNFESSVESYTPLWDAKINAEDGKQFRGAVIIARSPSSGTVHTAFYNKTEGFDHLEPFSYDIEDPGNCYHASEEFLKTLEYDSRPENRNKQHFLTTEPVNFCIESQNSNTIRNVRIAADGHNTSAVSLLTVEEGIQCRRQ